MADHIELRAALFAALGLSACASPAPVASPVAKPPPLAVDAAPAKVVVDEPPVADPDQPGPQMPSCPSGTAVAVAPVNANVTEREAWREQVLPTLAAIVAA